MNTTVSKYLYFTLQHFRGEPVKDAFVDLKKSTFHDIHRLRSLQQVRMLSLIRYAMKHVPFYKETYSGLRNKIGTINTWKEFTDFVEELPPLTKAEFNSNRKLFISEKIKNIRTTRNITSGSSGDPVSFDCDNLAWAYRHAAVYRVMELHGAKIGEPYGYFFGQHWSNQLRIKTALKDLIFNRVRVSAFSINEDTVKKSLAKLRSLNAQYWLGYPSAVYEFCSIVKYLNYDIGPLKAVFTAAEPLHSYQRNLIEEVTKSRCVNIYGSVEGGIGAFEGAEGGFHQSMENSHLWTSSSKELFATDLFLYANPLIKYEINDLVEPVNLRKSKLNHEQIGLIIGRSGKPIILHNGKMLNANLPSYILKPYAIDGKIRKYRFYYFPSQRKIQLLLTLNQKLSPDIVESLNKDCVTAFGDDCQISVEVVDQLPTLSNAKHRDFCVADD